MAALYLVVHSPFGYTLRGIRDSETRMDCLGYNVWLHNNIFGVDNDLQAVELAIFSLCITLAGHLEAERIWEELRFPKLKGSNLLAQDFFQVIRMVTFSSRYLVGKQSAIFKADIDRLPYPENPDDFVFVELEKILRDDVLAYQIDYIKYGDSLKAKASENATLETVRAYAEQFVSLLSTIYDTTHAGDPIDLPTAYCCPFYFGDHPTVEFGNKNDLCEHLDALLLHQRGTRLRVCRVTRLFDSYGDNTETPLY